MSFETKNIFLPEITSDTVYRKDLEFDGSLPEDSPDVTRLIRVDARPSKPSVTAENGKLCVKSDVVFGILYESDFRSKPAYAQVKASFSQMTDISAPAGEYFPFANVRCAFLTCKLLGARRFVIRASMETAVSVITVCERTVTDARPDENTFFRTAEAEYRLPCRVFTEQRTFEGSAVAPKPVSGVIFTDGYCLSPETQAEEGLLNFKVPVTLKAFCEGEDGGFFAVPYSFEASLVCADPDIDPAQEFSSDAHMVSCFAESEADEYGETRVIRFRCEICVNAVSYENTVETVADDAFCSDRITETSCTRADYHERAGELKHGFEFEKGYDTERTDIRGIIDMTVSFSVDSVEYGEGVLRIKGAYSAEYLAETDSGIIGGGFGDGYETSAALPKDEKAINVKVEPGDINCSVADGETVTLRGSAKISAELYSARSLTVLDSVAATGAAPESESGLTFYYPESSETSWDIAKRYRKDPAGIKNGNPDSFDPEGKLKPGVLFVTVK